MSRLHLRVGTKFFLAVGVLLPAILVVAGIGGLGLLRLHTRVESLYADNLVTSQRTADLASGLDDVDESALQLIPTLRPDAQSRMNAELDATLIPRVLRTVATLRDGYAGDPRSLERLDQIEAGLQKFIRLRRTGAYDANSSDAKAAAANADLAAVTAQIFDQATTAADQLRADEGRQAAGSEQVAAHVYASGQRWLLAGVTGSLLLGLGVVLALIRNLVPRIRGYSRFAADIAARRPTPELQLAGRDELTELGEALNDMVRQRELTDRLNEAETEYVETMQVTSTEEEAQELVQRQIERSVPGSVAVVLRRNNSANRLEPATALADEDLANRLVGAEPRSCLALRFARTHREGSGRQPLLGCALCGGRGGISTCEPLLVGGEVIGSVLVTTERPPTEEEKDQVKGSVSQAAPMLANLRTLALAEFRANNDRLTGLPNKRATEDTLKRMVAQANRSMTPLAAVMLDLDHFKEINDRFGHAKGDEVLAAVGAAIGSSLRASDFAGRFGGEEFLVLLPQTAADSALEVAERIRTTIAAISIPAVERSITASLGIAGLLEHAGSAPALVREADRAQYAAKAAGRNRTVVASTGDPGTEAAAAMSPSQTGLPSAP